MITTHPAELTAFLAALEVDPDCRATISAYQDWCEETGRLAELEYTRTVLELEQPCKQGMADKHHVDRPCSSCDPLDDRRKELLRDLLALPCPKCAGKGGRTAKVDGGYGAERLRCPVCGGSGDLLMKSGEYSGGSGYPSFVFRIKDPRLDLYGNRRVAVVRTVPVRELSELGEQTAFGLGMALARQFNPAATPPYPGRTFAPSPWSLAVVAALGESFVGFRWEGREPKAVHRTGHGTVWSWHSEEHVRLTAGHRHLVDRIDPSCGLPEFLFRVVGSASFATRYAALTALARATLAAVNNGGGRT